LIVVVLIFNLLVLFFTYFICICVRKSIKRGRLSKSTQAEANMYLLVGFCPYTLTNFAFACARRIYRQRPRTKTTTSRDIRRGS